MADLGEFLNSINQSKQNLMVSADEEKQYTSFVVSRSLSYHKDVIFLVNELNTKGTSFHGVDNRRHYEFFLNIVHKGKRFSKWSKPPADDSVIELLCRKYPWSRKTANDMLPMLSEQDKIELQKEYDTGGLDNARKKRGGNVPS